MEHSVLPEKVASGIGGDFQTINPGVLESAVRFEVAPH
jgi:hypothetical protein